MSTSWSGGKGDRSRVSDLKAYEENYNRIFRKEKAKEDIEEKFEEETQEESMEKQEQVQLMLNAFNDCLTQMCINLCKCIFWFLVGSAVGFLVGSTFI